jgi:hypothetical protein
LPENSNSPGWRTAPMIEIGRARNSRTWMETEARWSSRASSFSLIVCAACSSVRPATATSPSMGRFSTPVLVTRRSTLSEGSSKTRTSTRSRGPIW